MIDRLALALQRLGAEPTLDDLRDVLWLARFLPPALPLVEATAGPGAASAGPPPPPPPTTPAGAAPAGAAPPAGPVPTRAVDVSDAEATSGVYGAGQGGSTVAARRIRLPGVPALPEAMAIARALRPLGRRRAFGPPVVLDELASAERIAETQLPLPVLVPRRERWFEVLLAVEDTPSFVAWKATVTQLQRMLERHGGFRSVSRVSLALQGGAIAIRSLAGRPRPFASMSDRHGRRLVVVVSDCTSAAWHSGAMGDWLARLAPRVPLAIAQPLPASLWSHTALGFVEFSAHAGVPGTPTARLDVVRPRWADGEPGLVVPVVALEPDAVKRWARMVMASGNAFADAALVPPSRPQVADEPGGQAGKSGEAPLPSPLELLAGFRAAATAEARELATFLSAVKPLTLPVMRLLQGAMLPQSGVAALAQVLISGIVAPAAAASAPAGDDEVVYEMADAVREQLTTGLLRSDWLRVNLAVQRYVAEQTGRGFDFFAYLEDLLGEERIEPAALPFAQFARALADRFRAPGAIDGVAAARTRRVEEEIFGKGLTVRAARRLSTSARQLRWSADGQLAVLHQVGVDVFGARELALLAREREGPHRVEWVVHPDDRTVLEPLFSQLEGEAERLTGRPFKFKVIPFDRRLPAIDRERERLIDRSSASRTRLIALTQRFARDSAQRSRRSWAEDLARLFGSKALVDWTPVALDLAWADPAAEPWTRGWAGILASPVDSQATRDAVGALAERVRAGPRAEDGGRILDVAWGSGLGRPSELYSLRQASGESVITDAVRGPPGQTPQWLGAPHGPRAPVVDFDVAGSALAVAYANGEVWAWGADGERLSVQVYKGGRGEARAVRWSPQDRVLGWLDGGGFQSSPVDPYERAPELEKR